jgi:DNA-binding XRE family transcriptional regulator
MRVREKRPRTDKKFESAIVDRILRGPVEKADELVQIAHVLGFEDVSGSVPWREAFPDYKDEQLAGVSLAGARHKEGLTQEKLAGKLGVTQGYVSDLETGKRPISKAMAKKLGEILNIDYKVFL